MLLIIYLLYHFNYVECLYIDIHLPYAFIIIFKSVVNTFWIEKHILFYFIQKL